MHHSSPVLRVGRDRVSAKLEDLHLKVGRITVHVEAEPSTYESVRSALATLRAGFSGPASAVEALRIHVRVGLSASLIPQETPHGRYVPCDDGSYISRWGFWDARLTGFSLGREPGTQPEATLLLGPDIPLEYHPDGIRMFLRTVVASAAILVDSLMVHGCAMVEPSTSCAHLFVGASGEGKSTMATRLEGWRCLGDDTVLVSRKEGGFVLSGTPFPGSEGHPRQAVEIPLAKLYVLQPGAPELRLVDLSGEEAFGELLQRLMWFIDGGALSESMLDFQKEFALAVPAARLESSLCHDVQPLFGDLPC